MPSEPRIAASLTEYLLDLETELPEPMEVEQAVEQILLLLGSQGGVTFNLYFGDVSGQNLYAVSLYPERGKRAAGGGISRNVLRQFIRDNLLLLRRPENNIGLWYSREANLLYRDISAALPERQQAMDLASRYNQIAIFAPRSAEEIQTGGTGELMPDWPPESERLPRLSRGQDGEL